MAFEKGQLIMNPFAEERMISLPQSSPEAQMALKSGYLSLLGQKKVRVIARDCMIHVDPLIKKSVVSEVVFERIEAPLKRPRGAAPWLKAVRAFSLTATLMPCLVTWLFLKLTLIPRSDLQALCAILAVFFLQIAVNLLNDVADYRRLIDLPNTNGGSGVIQLGWWTPAQMRAHSFFFLAAGCLLGAYAIMNRPVLGLFAGALGFIGVIGYSDHPLGIKYRALGDITVFFLFGPVLTSGFSIAAAGSVHSGALLLGAYFGLLAMALLHVNNLQDMLIDRDRGINTLAILLGFRRSKILLYTLYGVAPLILIVGVYDKTLSSFILLAGAAQLLFQTPLLKRVARASGPESSYLVNCRISAAQIHLVSGLFGVLGLGIPLFSTHG